MRINQWIYCEIISADISFIDTNWNYMKKKVIAAIYFHSKKKRNRERKNQLLMKEYIVAQCSISHIYDSILFACFYWRAYLKKCYQSIAVFGAFLFYCVYLFAIDWMCMVLFLHLFKSTVWFVWPIVLASVRYGGDLVMRISVLQLMYSCNKLL